MGVPRVVWTSTVVSSSPSWGWGRNAMGNDKEVREERDRESKEQKCWPFALSHSL